MYKKLYNNSLQSESPRNGIIINWSYRIYTAITTSYCVVFSNYVYYLISKSANLEIIGSKYPWIV